VQELEAEVQRLRESNGGGSSLTTMRLLDVEGLLVRQAMERHSGNVSRAARALGLSRSALYRRLERHKITMN
jgi:transcriptional regulator of acetoin/glycerol metabolism